MPVGFPTGKSDIDARAGFLALQLRDTLAGVKVMKVWLDGQSTQDLVAIGYTETEASVLKSAYGDLDKLRRIFEGTERHPAQQQPPSPPSQPSPHRRPSASPQP